MIAPVGYESTAVWEQFQHWIAQQENFHCPDGPVAGWRLWSAFRDGYSAGLAEEDR